MFQFTTTNVINSDKDLTTGKALYEVKNDTLVVKRVANFKKENIAAIYRQIMRIKPQTVKGVYIQNLTVTSTMGPGIKVSPDEIA